MGVNLDGRRLYRTKEESSARQHLCISKDAINGKEQAETTN